MTSLEIHRNASLKKLNSFGLEARAEELVVVYDPAVLHEIVRFGRSPIRVIGGGSNILLTHDLDGLLLKNEIGGIEIFLENESEVLLKVGGGVGWHDLVVWAVEQGLGGIENLSLIPGTVGAAPIQNIGAYGVELKDVFHSLDACNLATGEHRVFHKAECGFGYRDSVFKRQEHGKYCIVHVYLTLQKDPAINTGYGDVQRILENAGIEEPTIRDVSNAIIQIRRSKLPDPAEIGNAGSFFKNPELPKAEFLEFIKAFPKAPNYPMQDGGIKIPAGWLIEQAGWKGKRIGDAGCHVNQALVLVNYGGATGHEILELAKQIQSDVLDKFGVAISPEVNIW